jgi:hypothetical protein
MPSTEPERTLLFRGAGFELRYPESYETEIIEDIPAFFDPMGGGVLQVATVVTEKIPPDLEAEMKKYLTGMKIEYEPEKIAEYNHPAGRCLACEFTKDERFWLINMIGSDKKVFIVLYNADEIPDGDTVGIVLGMIGSIRMVDL